jgi:outer membrane receptor protein involved in Fe transport
MLLTGGNADLKPERAETWSASLEFQPRQIPGLRVQLSYFATLYKNRIVTPITYTAQSLSNPSMPRL